MKTSEFRKLIREEIRKVVNEISTDRLHLNPIKELPAGMFKKLMPKTAATTEDAKARIESYVGKPMFTHVQYFEVQPNGNTPNRPTYRLLQHQYYYKGTEVNVTAVTVIDITEGEQRLGQVYVDTKVFLEEVPVVFNVLKRAS